jgi:hypothetical protein
VSQFTLRRFVQKTAIDGVVLQNGCSWWLRHGDGREAKMKMLDKTEQSDRASNPNEKPESCYCSALPKGSGLCLPCYTRWLARQALVSNAASRCLSFAGASDC